MGEKTATPQAGSFVPRQVAAWRFRRLRRADRRAAGRARGAVSVGCLDAPDRVASVAPVNAAAAQPGLDTDSQDWLRRLRATGAERDGAIGELHELLVRAARFEVGRRRARFPHLRGDDWDDLAEQSADDALLAILAKLDQYRGDARFTTWAYKFAMLEAAVKVRRRAWQGRELPLADEQWAHMPRGGSSPADDAEATELMKAIAAAIAEDLTPHQREILTACALNEVPIDVVAERLSTNRGAVYKTLHDARRKLRESLARQGLEIGQLMGGGG
jgi:RNA polymerase sigma-70 factor, ECF subfamily